MGVAALAEETSSNGSGGGGVELYEDIEAPKFVDFTALDHYNPDDRYWFCSRVGCDQKHDDEMDPDEIYKKFVLRVMAARSPNVRLRKALTRKSTNATKCPFSAPPKPSRPRISRLAVLSSISKKLVDGKERTKPIGPITATPNPKTKKIPAVSNALTTPGNKKKRVLKPELFWSVRKPKENTVPLQSGKVVAKALTFQSPKKTVRKKTSSELDASVRKICAGITKLEITGQRKNIFGNENRMLPSDPPKKKLGAREVKSRVYDSLRSQKHKHNENGPSRCMKKKGIETKHMAGVRSATHDGSSGDSSDMEVDSHCVSLQESSAAGSAKSDLFEVPVVQANSDELTREVTLDVETLVPSSEKDATENVLDSARDDGAVSATDKEGSHEVSENDDKENVSALNRNREQNEVPENDNMENASGPDNNRDPSESTMLGKQDTDGKIQKASQKVVQTLKENSANARSAHGGKYVKPRPTNPKPFRLRTDERGILKEANLEKKLLAPLKETSTTVSGFSGGNPLVKKHQNPQKRNGNVPGQSEDESSCQQNKVKIQQDRPRIRSKLSAVSGTLQRVGAQKQQRTPIITSQTQSRESIRRAKLLFLKQQSQRVVSKKKAMVSPMTCELRSTKGTSGKCMKPKKESKQNENAAKSTIKAATPARSRLMSCPRRPLTIPKEPNFHAVHVPKSCAQKSATLL
ncbi:uncharacterized protein LOC116195186 isoform X1 [Punica granatum]|uniref:Uncharacterized protein LOC116195186 isoform X1 n=2 Tax=Punica granatum TaxID=22663 RepID=A0A6P8CH55_PUNGR|nr:uncharacterized protein LOC116195186 isoform X1 [Punica granatum]PKI32645.1 hypothetical protein CRG98_046955 [Punica granatum]